MTFTVKQQKWIEDRSIVDDVSGGCFLTSADIFFSAKDENIPVTLEIRSTTNGYPKKQVLPFGRVVKQAADIIPDTTAETPTTFTFLHQFLLDKWRICYCIINKFTRT